MLIQVILDPLKNVWEFDIPFPVASDIQLVDASIHLNDEVDNVFVTIFGPVAHNLTCLNNLASSCALGSVHFKRGKSTKIVPFDESISCDLNTRRRFGIRLFNPKNHPIELDKSSCCWLILRIK